MLNKQAGDSLNGETNYQHNPFDFLAEVHENRIPPSLREEAMLSIL